MLKKRWRATVAARGDSPVQAALVRAWNNDADLDRFWTRRGAAGARDMYAVCLGLPLVFQVERIGGGRP